MGRYVQSDPIGLNGGLNTYGYVGGNPLRFIDLYGLTQADIDWALEIASQMQPDWNFPDSVQTWSQSGKGGKTTQPIFGDPEIFLDNKYLECLTDAEATALLNSLLHELAHYNQSWGDFTVDKFRERFSGGYSSNAQDAADQILWDQYQLVNEYIKNRPTDSCDCSQ